MATPKGERKTVTRAHVGTMGWSYTFWTGNLYPSGMKPKAFLAEYAKHFDTVELDNTFYRIPSTNTVKAWKEQTPEGFLFSAKFPRIITHVKMLRSCETETNIFLTRMTQLQNKLGPLLLQFPSTFGPKQFSLLQEFLPTLPRGGYRYAVEIRNKAIDKEKLHSLLKENDISIVLVTLPILEEQLTAEFVYVRLEGDRNRVNGTLGKAEVDRTEDTSKWASQIKSVLKRKTEVFAYFSKYYSGYPPSDAQQILDHLHAESDYQ